MNSLQVRYDSNFAMIGSINPHMSCMFINADSTSTILGLAGIDSAISADMTVIDSIAILSLLASVSVSSVCIKNP